MRSYKTFILKIIVIVIAALVLYLTLFWLNPTINQYNQLNPQFAYLSKGLLVCMYLSIIPFYAGIYFILKLINMIEHDDFFTSDAIKFFQIIKVATLCELVIYGIYSIYIYTHEGFNLSIFPIGLLVMFICFVLYVFIEIIIQLLDKAVNIKLENDLTI